MNIETWAVGCVFSNRKGHLLNGIVPTIGLLDGQDPSTQEVYGYWNRQGDHYETWH